MKVKQQEPWEQERKKKTQPNRVKSSEEPVEWHIGLMMFKCARKPLVNLNVWLKERASTLVPTEKLEEDTMGAYSNSPTHTHTTTLPPTQSVQLPADAERALANIKRFHGLNTDKHKALSSVRGTETTGNTQTWRWK